ncbi:SUA5/yciO/yrdC domain protein [Coriobacterium glomerans PW2]|uniref:L-threonylcarbamoyladenylate synthase n=1 Tax=Coriobacterium glomerans (strain ATCC 49209 / DSM 20642 / JCM 10262 / PW2) TaxID=700015 RepID=F2NAC0_CORGP|nr:L-threonylcarbamoyladenylate synthase [Coriobacterium glomerans]AEB06306.1 SUA5/yciO/yrdC domain protein [Coriobacterium glomerans PW2]
MPSTYRYGSASERRCAVEAGSAVLTAGGVALIPTETVYGIAVAISAFARPGAMLPDPGSGYRRIFSLKRRDLVQTLPLLVSGPADLDRFGLDIDSQTRCLAERFWPGALTLVVDAAERVPAFMRAADGTIALRASSSPAVGDLIDACGCPLAATSANTHAMPAPASFAEVEPRILDGVDVAIDAGPTPCADASTVIRISDGAPMVLREGALPSRAIEDALGSRHVHLRSPKES